MGQEIFDGKFWYSPPPTLSFNFFPYPKLMKYWKIPLRNFSALWDKKISKENLETFPAPLIHKHFRYRKTSATKHGRVPLRNFSALWDKKNRQIFVTKPSEAWKFSIPENSDTLKGCPTKFFGTVRQKKLTENGDTPPLPPLLHKFFRYQKVSETQHRRVPPLSFSALWDKTTSTEKRESPFLIPNIFW